MNNENLSILATALNVSISYLQNLPLDQIASLKAILKDPSSIILNCSASLKEVKGSVITNTQ